MPDGHFWLQWELPVVRGQRGIFIATREVQGVGRWGWRTISRANGAERWWEQTYRRKINGDGDGYLYSSIAEWHPHPLMLSHCLGTATSYSIMPPGEKQGVYTSCINLLMNVFQAWCFRFSAWKSLHSHRVLALVLPHQCLSRKWRYYPSLTVAITNSILAL